MKILFNGKELRSFKNIQLSYGLLNFVIRQYNISFGGNNEDFIFVRDATLAGDKNIIEIYITDEVTRKDILFLSGYVPYASLETQGNAQGGLSWRLSGGDIFNALEISDIYKSAFPNPPVSLIKIINNILDELNYNNIPIFNTATVGGVKTNIQTNKSALNTTAKKTQASNLVALDKGISEKDVIYEMESNFPKPDSNVSVGARDFLMNLLKFKNFFLLSNGADELLITKAGQNNINIGTLDLDYNSSKSNIISFSKNPLNNSRKLPCYLTTVIGQDSIETFIDDGLNIQKPLFVAGTCVDNGAIPNNQMIEFIKDIPITKSDAIKLATIIANTKRAFKNTITYTIEGTFFSDNGILYKPNTFVFMQDNIHNYNGNMLICDVDFIYDVSSGKTTTLTLAPEGSFTSIAPDDYIKILNKNKVKNGKKQSLGELIIPD